MIIDFHTHIFNREISQNREEYCAADMCFAALYSNKDAKLLSVEDLINSMDDNGISKSVLLNIGWLTHKMCVRTNDYIIDAITKYPSRLIGYCSIQALERDESLDEIERCFKAGASGIGELRPDIQGYNLTDLNLLSPIAEMITRFNKAVLFHASEPVGHGYSGKGNITPSSLYEFVRNFGQLKIVLAHLGGGLAFYELMPEVSKAMSNTYYDTAAVPFLYRPQIYKALVSIIGSKRILYGSDWPLLSQMRVIDHILDSGIEESDINNILGLNATNLV
jgi:uncharacterized protein